MKPTPSTIRLLAGPALLFSLQAAATTYYCDNDPDHSQYPHCSTPPQAGWAYHINYDGDWNNDDRRTSSPYGPRFQWTFGPTHTYSMSAWVANSAFTANVSYWFLLRDTRISHIHYMNQNTISRGWHSLGSGSAFALSVHPHRSSRTAGADIVRATFASSGVADTPEESDERIDTGSCASLSSISDPRIEAIQQKMLNAVDNYRDVSGSFVIHFSNNLQDDAVDFQVSEQDEASFFHASDRRTGAVTEHASTPDSVSTFYPDQAVYETTAISQDASSQDTSLPAAQRFYKNADCAPVYVERSDPANADLASEVTFPQNYAFWLTDSASQIVDHQTIVGREATVIEGHPDAYLQQKLGASTFKMWVDDATGVLLKLAGTNASAKPVFSVDVSNIAFDKGVKVTRAEDIATLGWNRLQTDSFDSP